MAFIAAAAGAAVGGGLLGGIVEGAIGIGLKLAVAYLFPQKIKGPRAESLKAQTSKYGDQLGRAYASIRMAGAVVWLKADHVDEHVKKYRQGKALGPEVTEYSYTATFAVAFAWNGPFAAIPRIWADDKLIYDASAESLQNAIDNGGSAIGVAKGATVTVYLGTDTQTSDPDIEADRGAGNVPAWPGVCYVVIKNLPLDEFGIRIPNIEAEIVRAGSDAFVRRILTGASVNSDMLDANENTLAYCNTAGDNLTIQSLVSGTAIASVALGYTAIGVHVSSRGDVLTFDASFSSANVYVYDGATGVLKQTIGAHLSSGSLFCSPAEISISGTTYAIFWSDYNGQCLVNSGSGWSLLWNQDQGFSLTTAASLSVGPDYIYYVSTAGVLFRISWSAAGLGLSSPPTIAGMSGVVLAAHYDDESDSLIVLGANGQIFVTTPDVSTVLRSTTSGGWLANFDINSRRSAHLKSGSDRIAFYFEHDDDTIYEYRVSDLALISENPISLWGRMTTFGPGATSLTSQSAGAVIVGGGSGDTEILFLPRASRGAEPLADIVTAEFRLAGLTVDATALSANVFGYGIRDGSPPRGVIEDLQRVNFFDFAQIDGVTKCFPRETAAFRSLSIDDLGIALNAEPDPVSITEEYPSALDLPEQVIITYQSYDAAYRIGAQAGTTDEDQKFNDEPSQADETGAPIKVRRSRPLEFSTAQVLRDDDAAKVADVMFNSLLDAATVYKTTVGPKHLDLNPGQVVDLALDEGRTAKAVLTRMSGDTVIEMEFRKRGDSFTSDAVGQPTPYVIDTLLDPAQATPALIDGHLLRGADDNDGFYAGVAVISKGNFRSATLYRSEDGGSVYGPWAGFTNGMIRGIAVGALPDRPHPAAFDRASSFVIAVPVGTPPDSVSEALLLASETSNGFAVWNASVSDWEYIRAASVVDNMDGTWTLSTLLRGQRGTEFAMTGHAAGAVVYHLDDQAMTRATEGDRTLSRIYVAVPTSTVFDSAGAVTFTNYGKGLRCWAPQLVSAVRDAGTGDWTYKFNRRDRLGQAWPESGAETPPMSESVEAYVVNIYDGLGVLVNSYDASSEAYTYTAADQSTDFGSPQTSLEFGVAQVSAIYGNGVELREAA